MILEYLLSNFEILVFFSICFIVIGFFLLFLLQYTNQKNNYSLFIDHISKINKDNKELKEYLIALGNLLEKHQIGINKISDKILFVEREINRLSEIKGSEDMLSVGIEMAKTGSSREEIVSKTGLRDDEVEAIYTYYKK